MKERKEEKERKKEREGERQEERKRRTWRGGRRKRERNRGERDREGKEGREREKKGRDGGEGENMNERKNMRINAWKYVKRVPRDNSEKGSQRSPSDYKISAVHIDSKLLQQLRPS